MTTNSANHPISTINFHGQDLLAIKDNDGNMFVAMKPIVEGMGLSWPRQFRKLQENKTKYLSCHMAIQVPGDDQTRETLFIPINKLNAWLFSVNPEKVRKDIRPGIIRYQEECAFVLYEYWHKGVAVNPRAAQPLPSPAAKPKAVKADRLIKITRHVVAAEMRVGVKAVCKSMGREPGKGDYKAGYKHFRVACKFMRFEDCTDEKAAAGLPDLRRRFDEQLEGLERCEGCVKVTIPWRPISPDGKHVISRAKAQAALPAAPAESEQVALPRLTTGAERKPLAVAVNKMIGANDEGPTRQKYMHFWRTLNAALGIKSIEELTADRLPAVMNLLELLASMITAPAVAPLPGSVPADYAALSPADQVNALLDAFEKTVDFAQNNTWAIETKLTDILKRVDIGPGMDHMQGMQVRQMINDLRIGFVHAMQPIQASLNAIRPIFWMLSAASKLGQRVGRALPAGPRLGGSLPA